MKKSFIFLCLLLGLTACQTPQSAKHSPDKALFDQAVSLYQTQD